MSAFRCTECGQDNEMETARFMRKIIRKDLIKYYTMSARKEERHGRIFWSSVKAGLRI